jgi:hypothetical protein
MRKVIKPARAEDSVNINPGHERQTQRRDQVMTSVSLGENSKLTVLPLERDQIRKFYREVLGCPQTRESERADFFQIGTNFYLGVVYDDSALSMSDRMKSIWLELRTDRPDELKQEILKFGIKEIEYFDKEHFYFQAPGGQVFRLAGTIEDMSKWQR